MNLPLFDKALLVLIVLELVIATNGVALADPPPDNCDSFCRERRYTKRRDDDSKMTCMMLRYRHCVFCNTLSGRCSGNQDTDKLTDGTCVEMTVLQANGSPAPETCDALCPFPVQSGNFYCEAAEGPNTYANITMWSDVEFGVYKCYKSGESYKQWGDEGSVTWKKKAKIDEE